MSKRAIKLEAQEKDAPPLHKYRKTEMVDLVVEGQVLVVSKKVVIEASPVFKAMLENERFIEGKTQTIQLPDKEEKHVVMMLAFITPRAECELPPEIDTRIMLRYADEYQIRHLTAEWEDILMKEINDSSNASLEHVYMARKYNLTRLLTLAIEKCSELSPDKLMQKSYDALTGNISVSRPLFFNRDTQIMEKAVDALMQPQDLKTIYRKMSKRLIKESDEVYTRQLQTNFSSYTTVPLQRNATIGYARVKRYSGNTC